MHEACGAARSGVAIVEQVQTAAPIDHYLRYAGPSTLTRDAAHGELRLVTTASAAFFSGFADHPVLVAAGLLAVARVARTRFYTPPNMLAALLRAADPVVSCDESGLRFESFSPCCGVYAKLDIAAAGLSVQTQRSGTTNVDVNPELRQLLAGVAPGDPLHLTVGTDALAVATMEGIAVERQVPLPQRWFNGFAQTQVSAAQSELQFELTATQTREFLRSLPRMTSTGATQWATPTARGARLASGSSAGAVCIAGAERLRVVEPLMTFATGLRAYGPPNLPEAKSGATTSFWEVALPDARLTIGLSPAKSRGFSGEGGVLTDLIDDHVAGDADLLGAVIAFHDQIDAELLAVETGLTSARVAAALAKLATDGQIGFDLGLRRHFRRELPFPRAALQARQPRLREAHSLIDADAVSSDQLPGRFQVRSGGNVYSVFLGDSVLRDRCLCPWYGKYRATRGPCKHVLAARLFQQRLWDS